MDRGFVLLAAASIAAGVAFANEAPPGPVLSPYQQAWLAAHRTIRVGLDPAWPPFSAADSEGKCTGIDVDLLSRLGRELGVTFKLGAQGNWSETYDAAKRGEFDLLAGTAATGVRRRDFLFTRPYFSFPVVIVTRSDEPLVWSMMDLVGHRIVGVRDYAPTVELQRIYPDLHVEVVDSAAEAMERVSRRDADAFISNLPNVSFVAKTHGLSNLKIAGVLPETFDLRYAVRPDWPDLVGILDAAIEAISEQDRQAIVHPWIRVDYAKVIRWDLVWKTGASVLAVLGVIIGAVVYHNRCLARELAARIRLQCQIEEARDQLLHMNEEKTELLQMAAHDLRGPLTGMQLVVDASLRLGAVPKEDALALIENKVRQMAGLLNDLLEVDALEHGRREFQLGAVSPLATLHESLAALQIAADQKQVRIDFTASAAVPPLVRCDPTALRQMLDNLLSNAIKFTPPKTTVTVRLDQSGSMIRYEFRDQGPGVAPDETERIFVKYARGTARPTAGEKSTGLGLSIVRQLVAAMNGRVWCEAGRGGGFFVLMMPAAGAGDSSESRCG